MFLSICFLLFLLPFIESNLNLYCPNGRPAFWTFDLSTFNITAHCSTPGQSCHNKIGRCNKQHMCCPSTLRMSSKSKLYDRATNIQFIRIGDDYKNTYRLYELNLSSNKHVKFDDLARWNFFDETLRELFEMPNARFWYPIKNCMENSGIAYAFVPLNATSVTTNISAMTILTRRNNSVDTIYICYIATKKEYRRQGIATRLLQQIVQRALDEKSKGTRYLTVHVNTMNINALELYEKCGWRCYQYLPGYLDREPHHSTNDAYGLILDLDNVKNATGLCRDSNAVQLNHFDNDQSMQICHRVPAKFFSTL